MYRFNIIGSQPHDCCMMSHGLGRVVYVYSGEGACANNTKVLLSALRTHLNPDSHCVQAITPEDTVKGNKLLIELEILI